MQRAGHDTKPAETRAEEVPLLFWFVLASAVAAVLLLTLSAVSFDGFDRLLHDGEPFLPYFTT